MEQAGEGEQGSRGSPEGSLEAGKSVQPEVGGPGTDPGPPSLLPEAYGEKLLTDGSAGLWGPRGSCAEPATD